MTNLGQFMHIKSSKPRTKNSALKMNPDPSSTDELAILILNVVSNIPFGKVATYGQIAALAGLPRHARLVGRVLSRMHDASEVPWHRVINAQGRISLSRLDDHGFNEQQARLLSEGVVIKNGKMNFKDFGWNI